MYVYIKKQRWHCKCGGVAKFLAFLRLANGKAWNAVEKKRCLRRHRDPCRTAWGANKASSEEGVEKKKGRTATFLCTIFNFIYKIKKLIKNKKKKNMKATMNKHTCASKRWRVLANETLTASCRERGKRTQEQAIEELSGVRHFSFENETQLLYGTTLIISLDSFTRCFRSTGSTVKGFCNQKKKKVANKRWQMKH